jgi:hypothetical protein
MPIEFDVRRDCPLATAPAEQGTSLDAFNSARAATTGFVDEIGRINADARFTQAGKTAAIWKLSEARETKIESAEELLKRDRTRREAGDSTSRHWRSSAGWRHTADTHLTGWIGACGGTW